MGNYIREQERVYEIIGSNIHRVGNALVDATDEVTRLVSNVYATYLQGKSPDEFYGELINFGRLRKLTDEAEKIYASGYKEVSAKVMREIRQAFTDTYYRMQYLMHFFVPEDLKFIELRTGLTEYALRGSSDLWQKLKKEVENLKLYTPKQGETLTSLLAKGRLQDVRRLKESLNRYFLSGDTFSKVRKDLTKTFSKPLNISRILTTEITRLSNLGAYTNAVEISKQGIDQGKRWLATLDVRTRSAHQTLDGQETDVKGFFKFGGSQALFPGQFGVASLDISCRCTHIYIVAGLSPVIRRGRNPVTGKNEAFNWKTYPEWIGKNKAA